jgi:hypothetical protein
MGSIKRRGNNQVYGVLVHRRVIVEFIRTKCLSPRCPAMACPSQTGYCSYHDLQRTPLGRRPGRVVVLPPDGRLWLKEAEPVTEMVQ